MIRPLPLLLAACLATAADGPPREAVAAAGRKDWPAVIAACSADFDRADASEAFWTLYARAAVEAGDQRLAAGLIEGALIRFPASDDIRRLELGLLARSRRPSELLRACAAWLERHPDDVEAWLARAWAAQELGDPAGASAGLEAAVLLRPDDRELRHRFADLLRSQGQPRTALAHYRRLIEGSDAALRLAAATCAGETGDPRQGMGWLAADTSRESRLLGARLALQAGDEAAASTALDAILAAGEADPRVLTWAGHLAERRGDLARAEACYAQAATAPDAGAAVLRLADLHRRTGRVREARELLEALLRRQPGDTAARTLLESLPR